MTRLLLTGIPIFSLSLCLSLSLSACDRNPVATRSDVPQTATVETGSLDAALAAYDAAPTEPNEVEVKRAFARLDADIAQLDVRVAKLEGAEREGAARKASDLRTYRTRQQARYAKLKAGDVVEDLKPEARKAAEKVRKAVGEVGDTVSEAGKKIGEELRDLGNKADKRIR